MTDDLIKRAREALDGVTQGPWSVGKTHPHKVSRGGDYIANADPTHRNQPICDANARFIAAARDLVPAMIDRIEGLTAENARLRDALAASYTADDLRRAWEAGRAEALHEAANIAADIACRQRPDGFPEAASNAYHSGAMDVTDAIRAMTPPADLADKVKEVTK